MKKHLLQQNFIQMVYVPKNFSYFYQIKENYFKTFRVFNSTKKFCFCISDPEIVLIDFVSLDYKTLE